MKQSKLKIDIPTVDKTRNTAKINIKEWLTIDDVAAHFQTTPKTVRKWLYERKMRYYKVGGLVRIHRTDLKNYPICIPPASEVLDKL